jgi:hypothetical protein
VPTEFVRSDIERGEHQPESLQVRELLAALVCQERQSAGLFCLPQ